jgi:N-acetylglutamate synthase
LRVTLNEIEALEERALNAWPAPQTHLMAGWALRVAGGYTKRANSANALRADAASVAAILPEVEALYARHSLPPLFRLSPLAPPGSDTLLAAAGYRALDPTLVMRRPLPAAEAAPSGDVRIDPAGGQAWLDGFAAANRVPDDSRVLHDRIVGGILAQAGFATLYHGAEPVGYALGVLERGALGLFDVVIAEGLRRRGHGRHLTETLLAWGAEHGATQAYLQVVASNAPARALYTQLGFAQAYAYQYRLKD